MTTDTAAPELLRMDPFFRTLPQTHGFLQAAHDAPDDDTPRLVLADWLEEHDFPERAEFIRLQCGRGPGGPESWARQRQLWQEHRGDWTDGAMPHGLFHILGVQPDALSCWQRGLYERLGVAYVGAFVSHAERLLAQAPLRQVDLSGRELRLREGRQASPPLKLHWVRELAGCPHLRQLTMLGLHGRRMGPAGASVLAESPYLDHLLELDLRENELRNDGVAALMASTSLIRVRRLLLGSNGVGDEGVRALARSPAAPRLEELDLSNEHHRTAPGMALRGLPTTTPLEVQQRHQIGDRGVESLVTWPGLGQLRVLRLAGNRLTDEGLRLLVSGPWVSNLRCLDLDDNPLGDEGVRALALSPYLPRLTQLRLPSVALRPQTRQLLHGRPAFAGLLNQETPQRRPRFTSLLPSAQSAYSS